MCKCFNPATVWFELSHIDLLLFLYIVSIPQRSDLNIANLDYLTYGRWFQSRNGLIWTAKPVTHSSMLDLFQSRNGLIWTSWRQIRGRPLLLVSIPQRSDLNWSQSFATSRNLLCFNPATVWFEHVQEGAAGHVRTRFNPATVWFEPSIPIVVDWFHHSFNPATVWFERDQACFSTDRRDSFNPATVWFELVCLVVWMHQ